MSFSSPEAVVLGPALLDNLGQDTREIIGVACRCASIFESWNQAYTEQPSLVEIVVKVKGDFAAFHRALSESVEATNSGLQAMNRLQFLLAKLSRSTPSPEDVKTFVDGPCKSGINDATSRSGRVQGMFSDVGKGVKETAKVVLGPGGKKLDPKDKETQKLVANTFRTEKKIWFIPYSVPTWVSLPPPVDLHVYIQDKSSTHENTRVKPLRKKERYEAAVATLNTLGTLLDQLATCSGKLVLHWISISRMLSELRLSILLLESDPTSRMQLGFTVTLLDGLAKLYSDYSDKIKYLLMLTPPAGPLQPFNSELI